MSGRIAFFGPRASAILRAGLFPPALPKSVRDVIVQDLRANMQPGVWRTKVPEAWTRCYPDVVELHSVFFRHRADRDLQGPSVSIEIPEEAEYFQHALKVARRTKARISVVCDTSEQATEVAARIARELPRWRRESMEKVLLGGGDA